MLTPTRIHARDVRSTRDLLMLLNFELSAYDECAEYRFTSVKPSIRDETGSNWRGAKLETPGAVSEAARNIAKHVVEEVREEYNLE